MQEISKAITAVMSEIHWVKKWMTVWTWTNSYKWVSDKDVREKIRVSMITNWLSILPIWWTPKIQIDRWEEIDTYAKVKEWEERPTKTKQSVFTDIETKYLLLHTSWESIEIYGYGQWVDSQDKWAGKATTYALKNTLLNMFLVPTWVDTDNTHSDDIEVPKPAYVDNWLPRIDDTNIENLKKLISEWKTFTIKDIREKYKVASKYVTILNWMWIK